MLQGLFLFLAVFFLPAHSAADPYYATFTAAILKADHLDRSLRYKDISIRILPERDSVPLFGSSRNKLTLRLWQQKEPAPLMVLISGLGGGANAGYHNFLASQFFQRGFHVLVFPSPLHYTFAVAASRSGFPGVSKQDSADLYGAMEKGLQHIRQKEGVEFSSVGLLGVSLGALHGAYISELDRQEGRIGFQKTLLINPPYDPLFAGAQIDLLRAAGDGFSREQKRDLKEKIYLFGLDALTKRDIKDPGYFIGLESRLPTTLEERKFLIGNSLREFLAPLIFATQQVRDLGVLKSPVATKKPEERLKESEAFSLSDYVEKFLLPGLSLHFGREISVEELLPEATLAGVEGHLRDDTSVFLFHNADDFIVSPAQLERMREIFGPRLTLHPDGGHLGNLWQPEVLRRILGAFEGI